MIHAVYYNSIAMRYLSQDYKEPSILKHAENYYYKKGKLGSSKDKTAVENIQCARNAKPSSPRYVPTRLDKTNPGIFNSMCTRYADDDDDFLPCWFSFLLFPCLHLFLRFHKVSSFRQVLTKPWQLDNETTAFNPDHREQLDLSTPHPVPGPEAPLYHNLLAPNQWPSIEHLPNFRPIYEDYMRRMSQVSTLFTSLIAEAIGLQPDAFSSFFDSDQQHKLKIVKYPEVDVPNLPPGATEIDKKKWEVKRQGVGPHKDSMLTSYLLQASSQLGLQAQNAKGEWIDCKPIDGTLVVAIGQGMEALTDGVCASTTHRVLSPRKGEGARYSVPFFQGVSYDAKFEAMDVPKEVLQLRDEARKARKDDVECEPHPTCRMHTVITGKLLLTLLTPSSSHLCKGPMGPSRRGDPHEQVGAIRDRSGS